MRGGVPPSGATKNIGHEKGAVGLFADDKERH